MTSYDAIVIGGGTNGLAAAGRLAKAGRKLIVLERSDRAGGGARSDEFAKGHRASSIAHTLTSLDPRVERGLELARHGLGYAASAVGTTALCADGRHLLLEGSFGARLKGSISETDRAAWSALRAKLLRFAGVIRPLKDRAPPGHGTGHGRRALGDQLNLASIALKARLLGRDDMRELMRMLLMNVCDVLDDEIGDDRLKGAVAFDAVLGAHLGPRSPNTLILLLNRLASEAAGETATIAVPRGGMGSLADAMSAAVTAMGVEIRSSARVGKVLIENDRATGVVLETGQEIRAKAVVSAINPKTTFLDLIGPRHLDTEFVRRARNIRCRGMACKLHLAHKDRPDFKGADLATRLIIAPSIGAIETAFDAAKYGGFSPDPVMEIMFPSAFEIGHAPPGRHTLSAIVQYAPYALKGGWGETGRAAFLERTMATLEVYAPGIGSMVETSELLTPTDLEERFGFVGGNWHHGELAVEQMLFLRPMIGAAGYMTPIAGLYLASAGCHPGGGVSGAAGWNAAEHILASGGAT
jgi:phytoene dehydrogenase-like protein